MEIPKLSLQSLYQCSIPFLIKKLIFFPFSSTFFGAVKPVKPHKHTTTQSPEVNKASLCSMCLIVG